MPPIVLSPAVGPGEALDAKGNRMEDRDPGLMFHKTL